MIERRMSHPAADIIPKKIPWPAQGQISRPHLKKSIHEVKKPESDLRGQNVSHLFNLIAGSFEEVSTF
ncbi:hypothetical protein [Rhizobium leguminosarum]|jgi:hypothetical protein|uniref:hypothetical protein n=1 Tax=Rhizobium leguminosarum TaxID=384 RepID=UPI0012FA2344|nr:hypothetical protein [Rhizobium leguminosarum]MBY2926888.1 hypothetical protein [Rhizobium leguminosarum]MBY3022487.1 hypothetical protein [Rhizobium leguminosarum]